MESHNYKKNKTNYFARSMSESVRYQLPHLLPKFGWQAINKVAHDPRFSVSSKDGSNVEGFSASSSEDDL